MNCPICGKEGHADHRPFCSRRCADLDLGNWLSGRYSMPSGEFEDTDDLSRAVTSPDRKLH